jgi:hypothetical protein
MIDSAASAPRFNCPSCGVLYTVVQVEPDATSDDHDVACAACGSPLRARDWQFVLKYFRLRHVGSPDRGRYTVV